MGGLAGLPDISDEDWLSYQADTFRRQVRPTQEALQFRSAIQPMLQQASSVMSAVSEPITPVAAQPAPDSGIATEWDSMGQPTAMAPAQSGPFDGPLFGGQETQASSLLDELGQLPLGGSAGGDGAVSSGQIPPSSLSPSTPGLGQPGVDGAPDKPNVFSWAGTQLGNLADAARGNSLLESGQGQFARGAVRGLSDVLHGLGGSAESVRQGGEALGRGDVGGALGGLAGGVAGTANAVLSPGDVFRGAAREMDIPKQIFPQIDPETPVIGGLNNPRELAGLIPELLIPETALEKGIGGAIGKVAKPIMGGIGDALQPAARRIGEVVSPVVDDVLGSIGRGSPQSANLAVRLGADEQGWHGTSSVFDRMQPGGGMLGDGVYTGNTPAAANEFAWANADPWTELAASRLEGQDMLRALDEGHPRFAHLTPDQRVEARDRLQYALEGIEQDMASYERSGLTPDIADKGANVRQITLPKGLNIWDANEPATAQDLEHLLAGLRQGGAPRVPRDLLEEVRDAVSMGATKFDVYDILANEMDDRFAADGFHNRDLRSMMNRYLAKRGYDGISYEGPMSLQATDWASGQPLPYRETNIFPESQSKIRNTLSGQQGGIATGVMESPFFSPARTAKQAGADIALGTAGAVAGAATAPEDATWQERAGRAAIGGSLAAGIGPVARAPKGIAGLLREFVENEDGSLNLGAVQRGRLNPPEGVDAEAWRGMSRNERRRANYERRRGEYAGRTPRPGEVADYTTAPESRVERADAPEVAADQAYDDVYERQRDNGYGEDEADETAYAASKARQVEAEDEVAQGSDRLYEENPAYYPDDDPTPKEAADEAVRRLTEGITSPTAQRQQKERLGRFTEGQEGLGEEGVTGAMKKVADYTGSTPAGSNMEETLSQMNMWDMDEILDPDQALPKLRSQQKRRIEMGEQTLEGDSPESIDYAKRITRGFRDELEAAHGRGGDAAVREAADLLEPYILDVARNAGPGQGTSAPIIVALQRAVQATNTPAKLAYDRWKSAVKNGEPPAVTDALKANAKRLADLNAIYRVGLEAYSSESGRALRANRAIFGEGPNVPKTGGGDFSESQEPAIRDLMGTVPPRLKARERLQEIWTGRQKALRKGEAEPVSGEGYSWDDIYWEEIRRAQTAGRSGPGESGRSQGGALEREGFLWEDLFVRDDPAMKGRGIKLTENERMRWLYGMEELGIGTAKFDKFWDRMADLNPDDQKAVLQFWNDVAKEGGSTTYRVPVETVGRGGRMKRGTQNVEQTMSPWERGIKEADKPLPNQVAKDWEGYLDAAETMPRKKALELAERVLKSRLDKSEKALAAATTAKNEGEIKRYTQAIATAKKDLNDGNGLYAMMEREYPPEIKGRSSQLQVEAGKLADRAARTDTRSPQGLIDQQNLQEQSAETMRGVMPAWQREQYQPGASQGYYDDAQTVIRKAQLLQRLDEVNRAAQFTRGALSVATSNMLTSARMVEASAMESAFQMANHLYTQAVWRGDPQGAMQMAKGMWAGATPAWNNLVLALKTGQGPMEALDFLQDVARNQGPAIRSDALRGKIGYMAPMHRISRGIQEFFTTLDYYGELNRLAHEESGKRVAANAAARGGEAVAGRVREVSPATFFANPTEEMRRQALQKAADIAAGGPHSAVSKMIANLKSNLETGQFGESGRVAGAALNVLFPFVYGIDFSIRSGLKILGGPVWYGGKTVGALAKGDTQAARAGATAFGLTLATDLMLFDQISKGNITGKGPSDPDQRQALMESVDEHGDPVWRPDSMRIPLPNGQHMWLNYTSLPVVGITGSIMANMWDAYMWDGKKDMTPVERFTTLAANTAGSIAEGTFFRDTLDLASILTQPQSATTALSRFAGSMLSRAIPGGSLLRQIAYASDPNRKTPENLGQEIMQGVPGLRGQVPNQISPYTGQPVDMQYSWATPFSPGTVYYGQGEQNPVANEALRLQRQGLTASPGSYSATQQGRGATVFEQKQPGGVVRGLQGEIAQETGPRARALISSPQYQAMDDATKAATLESLFTDARSDARFAMQSVPGVNLSPTQQLGHAQAGVAKYYGVTGTPEEIDRKNREIGEAKAALAQYNQMYGPDMGEIMLRRVSPQAWRLALIYEEVDPDIRWLRERNAARAAGLNPALTRQPAGAGESAQAPLGTQFVTPDYVPNLLPPPATSLANRLPPSARR